MLRYAVLGVISLAASSACAQSAPPASPPSSSAIAIESSKPVVAMEEPKPGDHWTFEVHDEITGKVSATRENVVTEVTPANISIRVKNLENSKQGLNVYDRSWNLVENPPWRYSPNDGSGIRSPLAVGKTWPVQTNNIDGSTGNVWKRSGTSKVVAQETVTTKAGTFETFKIETAFTGKNLNNPIVKNEVTPLTWYAPAIDHWVKRTFVSRTNKHLLINNTFELIEYGRGQ
jgi:hypothetical protein